MNDEGICIGPECDRPIRNKKRSLCAAHSNQWNRNGILKPLSKPGAGRGGHNRKFNWGDPCKHETCEEAAVVSGYCRKHYNQYNKHGETFDERRTDVMSKKGFSTDRYCKTCKETVDWKKYHLEIQMCVACHKEQLRVENLPEKNTRGSMSDLLAFIDEQLNTE